LLIDLVIVVTFYFPKKCLFHYIDFLPSLIRGKYYYNHQTNRYTEILFLEWRIVDLEIIENIFGSSCFKERNYPDSKGIVNIDNQQGGVLKLRINDKYPITLVYNSFFQEMDVKFQYYGEKYDKESKKMQEIL